MVPGLPAGRQAKARRYVNNAADPTVGPTTVKHRGE
jgi:hypothetical protein